MAVLPSASYSLTVRLQITNRPGMLGRVASAIGDAGVARWRRRNRLDLASVP